MRKQRSDIFRVLKGNGICKSRNLYLYPVEYFYLKNQGFFGHMRAKGIYQQLFCTCRSLKGSPTIRRQKTPDGILDLLEGKKKVTVVAMWVNKLHFSKIKA